MVTAKLKIKIMNCSKLKMQEIQMKKTVHFLMDDFKVFVVYSSKMEIN